jgi:hypothetical protein
VTPLEASKYKPLDDKVKDLLLRSDVIPVNDYLVPYWENKFKIMLLYGSYGSGKSIWIVDKLIDLCLTTPYFRCYYGRKVFDTVRGSVFKTITDRIKELKKEHLFHFSDAPNGSMTIVCRTNRNEFHPFGANNASSLKSIKDPTHFFCEEFDQFEYGDFGPIYSRLRTEKAYTQLYAAFNTEKVFKSHWIRAMFFDGPFASECFKLKVNYYHNHFIDQADYYKKLQLIANGNEAILNAIAEGEWGMVRTGAEFLKQFSESKNIQPLSYQLGAVYLCFDENVVPYVTCIIAQVRGRSINQVGEITGKAPNNNAPKTASLVADWLDKVGHKDAVFVCGDPSASKRSTVDENSKSFYDKIIMVLTKRGYHVQNKVMKSAPQVALSGSFLNDIFESMIYGWQIIIGKTCFTAIEDYMLTKEDAEGKVLKETIKDKETGQSYQQRGHFTDALRYLVLTILARHFEHYKGIKSKKVQNQSGYFG